MVYQFIVYMWIMNRMLDTEISTLVTKGHITQNEADTILATPKANE